MNQRTINEIAGNIDPRNCQPSDHPITADERAFTIEIASERAAASGIDLDEHVRAHDAMMARWDAEFLRE